MKKFTILAGLMTLALFIGVAGTSLRAGTAEARPTDVITFSPGVCVSVVVNSLVNDEGESLVAASAAAPALCYGIADFANLNSLAEVLDGADITEAFDATLEGAVGDPDTYGILVDRTAAQLGDNDDFGQDLWVLIFVTNDQNVHLDADEGVWASTGYTSSQTDCEPAVAVGIDDDDCNDDAGVDPDEEDGVVVDILSGANDILDPDTGIGGTSVADRGDAIVTATQSGIDVELDYTVVGMPDDITVSATKEIIQEGAADEDCDLPAFTSVIGLPQIAGLLAEVVDDDGTAVTGISVNWDTSDDDVASLALWQEGPDEGDQRTSSYTIASSGQVSAPMLACGQEPGEATFTAALTLDTDTDDEIDITVVGAPASMTLAANPPSIACNGVNSADVTATLLDSAGAPVVAGNEVRFEVVALGISDPIIDATDENGVATSKITPLSGVTSGVTVLVSVVDDDSIEGNILVACTPGPGTIPGPVVAPVTPPVTPPRTGDGGYLP